uniref:Uncharacterized protein n=1 Tax=Bactrocera dorsalis TaxID=27457 RepID=A0A034WI98_BACDO
MRMVGKKIRKKSLAGVKAVYIHTLLLLANSNKQTQSEQTECIHKRQYERKISPCCMDTIQQRPKSASWQEIGSIAKVQKPKFAKGNIKVANKRKQRNSTDSQICVKRFSSERESL